MCWFIQQKPIQQSNLLPPTVAPKLLTAAAPETAPLKAQLSVNSAATAVSATTEVFVVQRRCEAEGCENMAVFGMRNCAEHGVPTPCPLLNSILPPSSDSSVVAPQNGGEQTPSSVEEAPPLHIPLNP